MFERFTEDAIRVMERARAEARRLEFAQVQPEHLLLALLGESRSATVKILALLGADTRKMRTAVERRLGRGYTIVSLEAVTFAPVTGRVIERALHAAERQGSATVDATFLLLSLCVEADGDWRRLLTDYGLDAARLEEAMARGLTAPPMTAESDVLPERFSPRLLTAESARILELARQEAIAGGHCSIGTEQVLLGMCAQPDTLGGWVLGQAGLSLRTLRVEIYSLIGKGSGTIPALLDYTHIMHRALEAAWRDAKQLGHRRVGTGHLLLGLLDMDEGSVSHLLNQLNLDGEAMRWSLLHTLKASPDNPEPPPGQAEAELVLDPLSATYDDMPPDEVDDGAYWAETGS
jgi:ATP-dependent Clp protease ATP-binding subunit ClpA